MNFDLVVLPPPMSFKTYLKHRSELAHTKSKSVTSAIVVSPSKPHKILSVSNEISNIFDFPQDTLCGRSIRVFQGPKSDAAALDAAIRRSGIQGVQNLAFIFYTSSGVEYETNLRCVPLFQKNGKMYGCSLLISMRNQHIFKDIEIDSSADFPVAEQSSKHLLAQRLNREYRSMYNAHTGLLIHQAWASREAGYDHDDIMQPTNTVAQ